MSGQKGSDRLRQVGIYFGLVGDDEPADAVYRPPSSGTLARNTVVFALIWGVASGLLDGDGVAGIALRALFFAVVFGAITTFVRSRQLAQARRDGRPIVRPGDPGRDAD